MTESTTEAEQPAGLRSYDLLAVGQWIVGDDTGSSSKWLLATALGGKAPKSKWAPSYPRDASDLGRCIRLIELAPSVRDVAFPVLSAACEKWDALIAEWDSLAFLYATTPEGSSFRYRVVTSRMDALFRAANAEPTHPRSNPETLK